MDDLVKKLCNKHKIEIINPEKSIKALIECINRNYVHILFTETGTELGIQIDKRDSIINDNYFKKQKGQIHLVGFLTLNYVKVRCIADINLETLSGQGWLEPTSDEQYYRIIKNEDD